MLKRKDMEMTIETKIKSLACLKAEKLFIGIIDKGYPRRIFDVKTIFEQYGYVIGEFKELHKEMKDHEFGCTDYMRTRNEIADCINTLEILYEMILQKEIKRGDKPIVYDRRYI